MTRRSMAFMTLKHYQTSSCPRNIPKGYSTKRHVEIAPQAIGASPTSPRTVHPRVCHALTPNRQPRRWQLQAGRSHLGQAPGHPLFKVEPLCRPAMHCLMRCLMHKARHSSRTALQPTPKGEV
jgi:hypothetical protein